MFFRELVCGMVQTSGMNVEFSSPNEDSIILPMLGTWIGKSISSFRKRSFVRSASYRELRFRERVNRLTTAPSVNCGVTILFTDFRSFFFEIRLAEDFPIPICCEAFLSDTLVPG